MKLSYLYFQRSGPENELACCMRAGYIVSKDDKPINDECRLCPVGKYSLASGAAISCLPCPGMIDFHVHEILLVLLCQANLQSFLLLSQSALSVQAENMLSHWKGFGKVPLHSRTAPG